MSKQVSFRRKCKKMRISDNSSEQIIIYKINITESTFLPHSIV